MATNYIKNAKGRTVAHIVDTADYQILYDERGHIIAQFHKRMNQTSYPNGSMAGKGNLLQSLAAQLL